MDGAGRSGFLFAALAGAFAIGSLILASRCSNIEELVGVLVFPTLAAIFSGLAISTWLGWRKPRWRVLKVVGSVAGAIVTGTVIAFLSIAASIDCIE